MTRHVPALLCAAGRATALLAAVQVLAWPGVQWPFALCDTAAAVLFAHAARRIDAASTP